MFIRSLVVGVSLVALLGGEGRCGDPDSSFYTSTRARAAQSDEAAPTSTQRKSSHTDDHSLEDRLAGVRKALQDSEILSDAVAAKLGAWVRSEKEKVQGRAGLLCEAVTANTDDAGNLSMESALKARIYIALVREDKQAIAHTLMIWKHAGLFFTKGMDRVARTHFLTALAPLTAKQIEAIATHSSQLFTENIVGSQRVRIIKSLAKMTPEQFAAEVARRAA